MIFLPSETIKIYVMIVVFEGTQEQYKDMLKGVIKEVLDENDSKKVSPLSKTQACEQLGITYKTLIKIMEGMKLETIFPSDIDRILLKYPKFIKKAMKG